jgi:putative nucleotidyltransferase with HDIG domain
VPATARTFRIGGDEFAILFDEADPQRVVTMLEEVRRAANVAGVGFSAGVALAPAHAAGPEALRHAADQALYASKRAGRGRVTVFEPRAGGPSSSAVLTRALERVAWRPGGSSELLVNLLDGLTSALDADRGLYFEHDAASDTVLPRHVRGRVARSPQERATYVLREWPECRRMLRTGQPIICAAGDPACDPSEAAYLRALGFGSMVMIPVPVDGVAAGFIELCFVASEAVGHAQLEHAIAVADIAGLALTQERRRAELEQAYLDTVGALSSALEAKDADTGDHARALAGLAGRVARRLGLPEEEARLVEYAAAFHDIGKIATPTEILRKRGPLTASERAEVERHVVNGARIVSEIGFLRPIVPAVRHSHERWDGGGYPDGLEGEAIPLAARIVFACDAWHAMTTDRPYRRALPPPRAAAELAASAGSQFDPAVVRALLAELGDAAGGAAAA